MRGGESSVAPFGSKRNSEGVFCEGERGRVACHATMGPHGGDIGVPRGTRGTKETVGRREGGEGGRVYAGKQGRRRRKVEGGEAKGEMQQQQLSLPVPPFALP